MLKYVVPILDTDFYIMVHRLLLSTIGEGYGPMGTFRYVGGVLRIAMCHVKYSLQLPSICSISILL